MFAVALPQPWAWAVTNGHADVINKLDDTKHRGPLAIYANTFDGIAPTILRSRRTDQMVSVPDADALPLSAFVGIVEVVDCIRNSGSFHARPGYWHWVLAENPRPTAPYFHAKPSAWHGQFITVPSGYGHN